MHGECAGCVWRVHGGGQRCIEWLLGAHGVVARCAEGTWRVCGGDMDWLLGAQRDIKWLLCAWMGCGMVARCAKVHGGCIKGYRMVAMCTERDMEWLLGAQRGIEWFLGAWRGHGVVARCAESNQRCMEGA